MQNDFVSREPRYTLHSVDSALQLLQLLRDAGSLRVVTAAEHLGVAKSTAHRLLNMLTYRGFAVQDEDRVYRAGPGMNVPPVRTDVLQRFRNKVDHHFQAFVERTQVTVSLVARFGTTLRFIETYVSGENFAISSRRGHIFPARHASGGKALLSLLSLNALEQLYRSPQAARSEEYLDDAEFAELLRELRQVRSDGFALNREETERGLWALSMPFHCSKPGMWLAFAVAVPSALKQQLTSGEMIAKCGEFRAQVDSHVNTSEQG